MKRYKTVDEFIQGVGIWQEELLELRKILVSTSLEETVKWGAPCYTFAGKNIVGMGAFQAYFGLWFFQGALLADSKRLLVNAQEGKTKALRQWRMQSKSEIKSRTIKAYVQEAIELQQDGLEIKAERGKPLNIPPQLREALAEAGQVANAFDALTPGRQREYADYISEAKRPETKRKRLEKILPMIAAGLGLNDKYRNC